MKKKIKEHWLIINVAPIWGLRETEPSKSPTLFSQPGKHLSSFSLHVMLIKKIHLWLIKKNTLIKKKKSKMRVVTWFDYSRTSYELKI